MSDTVQLADMALGFRESDFGNRKCGRRKPPHGGGFLSHWGAEEEV